MMKNKYIYRVSIFCLFIIISFCANAQSDIITEFKRIYNDNWKKIESLDLTSFDKNKWVLDGLQGSINSNKDGLLLTAGPHIHNDSSHVVLWYKKMLKGDVKIEYDFTRMDNSKAGSVNIIYIHALGSGKGQYENDIMKWNNLRSVPAMKLYFNNMKAYHISYAVTATSTEPYDDYVRARQYNPLAGKGLKGTELTPDYLNNYLFKYGVTYHITVILKDDKLYMKVDGEDKRKLFVFNIDKKSKLTHGYLGFRQMWGRSSRYNNLRIYSSKK